jgi:hypothetical protein
MIQRLHIERVAHHFDVVRPANAEKIPGAYRVQDLRFFRLMVVWMIQAEAILTPPDDRQ